MAPLLCVPTTVVDHVDDGTIPTSQLYDAVVLFRRRPSPGVQSKRTGEVVWA